jgi:predicted nucleic acid-binding protein
MPIWKMDGELMYLDTSGVLALVDADDRVHDRAVKAWGQAISGKAGFVMTDYVRLECWSILHRRFGIEAVEDFRNRILPICSIQNIDEKTFEILTDQLILSRRRNLSLVDMSSFYTMHRMGIHKALAFDKHFNEQGYKTPGSPDWPL